MHQIYRPMAALAVLAFLQRAAFLQPAQADVFMLRSGGHIDGDLMNADQNPRTSYVIAVSGGGQITLEAAVVEKVQTPRPELAEYEKMRRQSPDTVEGQMKLAEWCRDQGLKEQRKTALERVLILDPEQLEARRLLGYHKVKDQWMTHDEEMADKGYVKRVVNGETRVVTQEEADNTESKERQIHAEAAWRRNIGIWRKRLDANRAEIAAKKNLEEIHDPDAIGPLGERLNGAHTMAVRQRPIVDARQIYVEVLGRFNTHEARGPLMVAAIDDPSDEIRLACLDELEKQKDDAVTKYFVYRMNDKHASDDTIDGRHRLGASQGPDQRSQPDRARRLQADRGHSQ